MLTKTLPLLAISLALSGLQCSSPDSDSAGSPGTNSELGALPAFSLEDLKGDIVTDGDLGGKVALVNFWATWCGPCKIEMPWFVEFQRKYKDRDFTVVAISLDEDGWEPVRQFAEELELNFPVMLGDDSVGEDFGGIWALPTTLIVDRSGTISFRHMGLVSKSTYEAEIESLL